MKIFAGLAVLYSLGSPSALSADRTDPHKGSVDRAPSPSESCTVEALTRNCEVFSPDGPLSIELSDGTIIPNYAARGKLREASPEQAAEEAIDQRKKNVAFTKEQLTKKAKWNTEALAWLKKVNGGEKKPFSSTFHDYLAAHMDGAALAVFDDRPEGIVFLPWPPDKEGADVEAVPSKEAFQKLKELLGDEFETFDRLTLDAENIARLKPEPAVTARSKDIDKMMEENRNRIGSRLAHGKDLFAKVQAEMEKKLLNGRQYGDLSDHEKSLVDRIKSVTFQYTEDPGSCSAMPNAFYRKHDHTINVCTDFLLDPDTSLLLIFGHELAHAIDPCTSQFPLLKAKKDAYLKWVDTKNGVFNADAIAKPEFLPVLRYLDTGFGQQGADYLSSYPLALDFGEEAVQYFIQHPDKAPLEPQAAGVPAAAYPFKSVLACLADEKHDFKSTKSSTHADALARVKQYRRDFLGIDDPKGEQRILSVLKKHPECGVGGAHSEMGEAFADWMGAEILSG
ncbi:MAG: hypothetical protein KDD51_06300, partial [Bdellovibrionales bacterium]|nr:hypothetical protein [Bdellovibrionales bacterium]